MASDSSHWYDDNCRAVFAVPNKSKGGTRPTKITDAREMKLLPSVTTILSILAKPQLDRWKQEQVCLATQRTEKLPGEDAMAYLGRCLDAAFEQVDTAADLGTDIHEALEQHFTGKPYAPHLATYVEAVDKWVRSEGIIFDAHELRLASRSHGFAGTTDAKIRCKRGRGILDFKSRKTQPGKPCLPYDTQPMQIAAYHVAAYSLLPSPLVDGEGPDIGVNVFISTTEPGRVEACWYDHTQLQAEWRAFAAVRDIWVHL